MEFVNIYKMVRNFNVVFIIRFCLRLIEPQIQQVHLFSVLKFFSSFVFNLKPEKNFSTLKKVVRTIVDSTIFIVQFNKPNNF